MEKEMFAVVAIYKSEAVDYLNKKGIAREDALIINTVEDFEEAKNKLIKDVHFISAPMGIASNEDDLKKLLVTTIIPEISQKGIDALEELIAKQNPTSEAEVEEVKTTLKELAKREAVEPEVEAPEIKKPAAKKPVTRKKKITKE